MLFVAFLLALSIITYLYGVRPFRYWERKNVKCLKTTMFFGNMYRSVLQQTNFAELSQKVYDSSPNDRYVGFYDFANPILILRDPDLIKQITLKDFDIFPNHRQFVRDDVDPLWSRNLFSMKDDTWRSMRSTLSPSFTSSKMRGMFHMMTECADQFVQHFLKQDATLHVVEMKDVFTRYTNDVIATCAFGVQCDSLLHETNEFYLMGREASDFSGIKGLRFMAHSVSPGLMKLLGVKIFTTATGRYFRNVVMDTIKIREAKGIIRPDMIHLIMEARKGKSKQLETNTDADFLELEREKIDDRKVFEMTEDDIVAQALLFFFAGFDTASTLMCFLAYELAVNSDIQERLFGEVEATLKECGGKVTYEALLGMKYLDMVVSEALRKWPPTPVGDRKSITSYTIPPISSDEKPLRLPEGSVVMLPIFAIHRDKRYYPNPNKFDPERFSDRNKHKINPLAYFPFGAGPRICIGSRFALLENKAIIFYILRHFKLVPVEKTHVPMVLSQKHFSIAAEDGMWLGVKPRKAAS